MGQCHSNPRLAIGPQWIQIVQNRSGPSAPLALGDLPEGVLLHIVEHLGFWDICSPLGTNRQLRGVASRSSVWLTVCKDLGFTVTEQGAESTFQILSRWKLIKFVNFMRKTGDEDFDEVSCHRNTSLPQHTMYCIMTMGCQTCHVRLNCCL